MPASVLILGIGNVYRGDDGAGVIAARRLADAQNNRVTVSAHSGEGAGLMDAWAGYDRVILIDAVSSDTPPGTVFRLDASAERIPTSFFHYSTHAFSVAEAVELSRTLGTLPPSLVVYGIEGETFSSGEGLSAVVERAITDVVEQIRGEIT